MKAKLKKSKSTNQPPANLDAQMINSEQRIAINKSNSVVVNVKAQRHDRQGLPIIKIPRSEMESPSKKSKKDDKKKVYKVTFLDKIDKE